MKARISVGSSAFVFGAYSSNPIHLEKVCARLEELGYDGIELLGMKPYADPDEVTGSGRKKLAGLFRSHGLGISNYGADFHERSPASNDPGEREDYRKLFMKNLRFCADLEIPSIRVDTVSEPPMLTGVAYEDAFSRFAGTWNGLAEEAAREGVLVVWEFEPGFMFNKPSEIVRMVHDVGHDNFTVLYDSCHAHMCADRASRQADPPETLEGGEVELARNLGKKIGYVHLIDSDNTLHDNATSTHAPFGTGVIDFDAVVEAIKPGYENEWWTIDLCFWPGAWDILEESLSFMDTLLKKHDLR